MKSMWNRERAIDHLDAYSAGASLGKCASYTRTAIEAGGLILSRHNSAKDYGASLEEAGFVAMGEMAGGFETGDVVVIEGIEGHRHGHMAMFDGAYWVSDFTQQNGLYPGPAYRQAKPPYVIYRYLERSGRGAS